MKKKLKQDLDLMNVIKVFKNLNVDDHNNENIKPIIESDS